MKWILLCLAAAPAFAASCDSLTSLALPDTTVTMAQVVPAGEFVAPGAGQGQKLIAGRNVIGSQLFERLEILAFFVGAQQRRIVVGFLYDSRFHVIDLPVKHRCLLGIGDQGSQEDGSTPFVHVGVELLNRLNAG